jgi:hypothetical protein
VEAFSVLSSFLTSLSVQSLAQAEVERTWGVYLKKVKLAPAQGYFGSTAHFDLSDVGLVLDTKVTRTLGDNEQSEELCLFALKDGRSAAVWVAHCNPISCCGVCVYSVLGVVGPSATDVAISLPDELRSYATGFLRKSNTSM